MGAIIQKLKIYRRWKQCRSFFDLIFHRGKTIYLFGCPTHPNLGDQAQLVCIDLWLKANYPEYKVFKFDHGISYWVNLKVLRWKIRKDDIIFGHSGYFIVDHHAELLVYCKIAQMFRDRKFVIMPQTINFVTDSMRQKVALAFNNHPDFTLLCRDEISYNTAQSVFPKCRLLLFPDIVTSLIGTRSYDNVREGIQFCIRDDPESLYKPEQIAALRNRLEDIDPTRIMDTSISVKRSYLERHREELLDAMLDTFSKSKLIITDRYHGTIFSLIAGTPVIVLSSTDHKLSSGVKWFPSDFKDYVAYARDLDEAYGLAQAMLRQKSRAPLPPYFKEQYYDVLREKL